MQQATGAESVRWDLSDLYRDIDDPALDADLARLLALAKDFFDAHSGKLTQTLGAALDAQAEITSLADKLFVYLYLRRSTDATNERIQQRLGAVQEAWSRASADHQTFFEHELVAIDDATYATHSGARPGRGPPPAAARPHPRQPALPADGTGGARADAALAVRAVRVV